MPFPTIDQARAHCKADAGDDAMLALYLSAAISACARLANRGIFTDSTALTAARAASDTAYPVAYAAYDTALNAVLGMTEGSARDDALNVANTNFRAAVVARADALEGIVTTDDINAAILLTVGHLFRNREDVLTGQGAAAVSLPMGARNLMDHYRAVGPL